MKPPRTKPSLFFKLVIPATVVFIGTILALTACLFGDPDAPVNQWLDANGNSLLFWEFVAVVILSFLAMAIDRIRTLRGIDEPPIDVGASTSNGSAQDHPDSSV